MIRLTKIQARRFMLLKSGLIGEHRFIGKEGALDFVRAAGCIQFDPVDVCGKNAELTLQSRVKGFTKKTLSDLLYKDRSLVDYPDKNIAIISTEDWKYFERFRQAARECAKQFDELPPVIEAAREYISKHGAVCSDDLPIEGEIRWHSAIHWSGEWHGKTKAARSALEQLYSQGECIIHHKEGSRKYYDFAEKHLPQEIISAKDPLTSEAEHMKWRVKRRIGALGLMWNRKSDAFLGIWGLENAERSAAFKALEDAGEIIPAEVEGIRGEMYLLRGDEALLERAISEEKLAPRCEFLAPLDPMLWDRKLISSIFGFDYSWEIYTPAEKRKFGYYTLPILIAESFIGRIESSADAKTKTLTVKNIWFEQNVKPTQALKKKIEKHIERFAKFNGCDKVSYLQEL